jgi:hypothetical protein
VTDLCLLVYLIKSPENNPRLASVSRILATIYTVTCGIELFGALGAFLVCLPSSYIDDTLIIKQQRRSFIRTYAYLAFLSATLVTGAGVILTTVYFTFAVRLIYTARK